MSDINEVELEPFNQSRVVVSRSTGEIFQRNGSAIPRPNVTGGAIDRDSLATLLHSGVIFPPNTIYSEYASVGMGGKLSLSEQKISYTAIDNLFQEPADASVPTFDCIEELANSLGSSSLDFDNATLLLSEGKDSAGIALALAEIGVKIECLTFANADTNVEFVESLAKTLGHRLTLFRYHDMRISEDAINRLGSVFEPTLDQAFLSYLLLPMEQLAGRTLLDGMGNDLYMGHLPSKQQRQATIVSGAMERVVPMSLRNRFRDWCSSDNASSGVPFRSFTECQGFYNGFSQGLVEKSTQGRVAKLEHLDSNWRELGFERSRALSRGRFLDTYSYSSKTIALAEMIEGRVVFPWCDSNIAKKFATIDDDRKFNWPTTNKRMLRDAISKRISYKQPKVGFRAPVVEILVENRKLVEHVISNSSTLGPELIAFLLKLKSGSPRLACGFLYALWEFSTNAGRNKLISES